MCLPFAPENKQDWTEFHFDTYFPAMELAVGARRELTKDEIEQNQTLAEIEAAMESGDANWTKILDEKFGAPDFEAMLSMDGAMESITEFLDNQG